MFLTFFGIGKHQNLGSRPVGHFIKMFGKFIEIGRFLFALFFGSKLIIIAKHTTIKELNAFIGFLVIGKHWDVSPTHLFPNRKFLQKQIN